MTLACAACGRLVDADRIAVRAVCDGCGAWLHACRNCAFHAPGRHDDCSEPAAAPVADKEQANFCDWFRPAPRATAAPKGPADSRAQLEALFRKKPTS
ncbi:MAG TPA: hypothetical protein VKA21_03400 [Candidatus Binatia bacterium]|nr:hypothetical protein [Candidatus Binatia bacterium]